MFERYTEKARRVIFFARYEASVFGSPYIETEHFLLGLLREDKTLANRFLRSHAAVESIRRQIEEHTPLRPKTSTSVDLPLSRECKRILAYGAEESERLKHKRIGPEHLLIGVLMEEKSFAARLLHERGLELSTVRAELKMDGTSEEATPALRGPVRRVTKPIRFERFTEPAMRAALFAVQEASNLGSPAIEIEHLLLGVLREDRLEATRLLRSDAVLVSIRREIEERSQPNLEVPLGDDLVLSREYQRVLVSASEQSESLGHKDVQTGHLLLAIFSEKTGLACEILLERGVSLSIVRAELMGGQPL
jgi:ATP-dependent Clp protease ATP-binding subunit ClpA